MPKVKSNLRVELLVSMKSSTPAEWQVEDFTNEFIVKIYGKRDTSGCHYICYLNNKDKLYVQRKNILKSSKTNTLHKNIYFQLTIICETKLIFICVNIISRKKGSEFRENSQSP